MRRDIEPRNNSLECVKSIRLFTRPRVKMSSRITILHANAFRTSLIALLSLCAADVFADDSDVGLHYRIARLIHHSIRDGEQMLRSLESRLASLPPHSAGRRGASAGFHSRYFDAPDTRLDIVLDLGHVQTFDRLAVFSVSAVFQGQTIAKYGFPTRFTIDVSDDASFKRAESLAEVTSQESTTSRAFPFQLETPGASGRYLRLRVHEHWQRSDGQFLTALGEIMVLKNSRNIAIGAHVEAPSFTSFPDWSRENLVDGQTDLGLPIGPQPSTSNGFLSVAQRVSEATKWVQIELRQPTRVDEVRLIPAVPFDAPSQHGHGFPRRFRVLASATPDFHSPNVIADYTQAEFTNPGDNPVILPANADDARFIRLEATELWHISNGTYALALAEMQVFEDDRNVALGSNVSASDVFRKPPFDRVWKPHFLVDGFGSQNELIELDDWLTGLQERAEVEGNIAAIRRRIDQTVERSTSLLLTFAAVVIVSLVALTMLTIVRRKRALLRERDKMRTRIARDLHDDLGSRLGGMRLISETMLTSSNLTGTMREDLDLIRRSSREAMDAMRDIVWLLDNNEQSRRMLVNHMRQLAPAILGRIEFEFAVHDVPEQNLNFEFRRQVLFAFKECLANVAKHSDANRVQCSIGGDVRRFRMEVLDDGCGISEQSDLPHHRGLRNLQSRAESLGGTISIESEAGKGTRIIFDAPLRAGRDK